MMNQPHTFFVAVVLLRTVPFPALSTRLVFLPSTGSDPGRTNLTVRVLTEVLA